MAISSIIIYCVAFILVAESPIGESGLAREDDKPALLKEANLLTGGDVLALIEQLTDALNKLEDEDRKTRTMVDKLLSEGPEGKNRGKRQAGPTEFRQGINVCYGNTTCEERLTVLVPGRAGNNGERGDTGETGQRGPKGDKGSAGTQGIPGGRGAVGQKGIQGFPGIRGRKGDNGFSGTSGHTGHRGRKGQKGDSGTGSDVPTKTVYIRWGSKNCPATAQLLYEGFAAGAAYNQQGGGTNYLCLPRDPLFNQYRYGVDTWRAYLFGSEYEENNFPPLAGKDDGDVPCAVCLVTDRSVVLMQPARTECPDGWTREYFGYLMASAHIYYRSEWTCVDGNAALVSTQSLANSDGALFYPTEVCCGNAHTGLPCGIYPNGYELTCSVCSR